MMNPTPFWRLTLDTNPDDCNLHCIMCEQHSRYAPARKGPRRIMPAEWLPLLFEEAHQLGVREIIPSTMGEPLLYDHIELLFELYRKYPVRLNLTTNGTFPRHTPEEWAQRIVQVASDVKISWNGATAQTSDHIMQGSHFELRIEKLRKFIAFRDTHYLQSRHYCRLTFQLTFMQNNMHELAGIIELAAQLGVDRVKGHHLWTHFEALQPLSFRTSEQARHAWNRYVEQAVETAGQCHKKTGRSMLLENITAFEVTDNETVNPKSECPFLGRELWVSAQGKISPCCAPDVQRDSLGDFGYYPATSLASVLKSPAYRRLVSTYRNIPLCKTCPMRRMPDS